MTVTYQDVLEAICSEVSLVNENDTQHIFTVGSAREAKLAYDVLAAHGFDVRLYPEADTAKLYIIHSQAADNEQNLTSALHYAGMLRQLLGTMPAESEFNMTFANTPTHGKQISVYFPAAASALEIAPAPRPVTATPMARRAGGVPAKPVRRVAAAKKSDILKAGPELGKKYPFGIPSGNDDQNEMTFSKWLSTYIFSNFTESFYSFMGMAFATLVLLSLWVVVKGYLCPDIATVKTKAWYCISDQ